MTMDAFTVSEPILYGLIGVAFMVVGVCIIGLVEYLDRIR